MRIWPKVSPLNQSEASNPSASKATRIAAGTTTSTRDLRIQPRPARNPRQVRDPTRVAFADRPASRSAAEGSCSRAGEEATGMLSRLSSIELLATYLHLAVEYSLSRAQFTNSAPQAIVSA